MTALWQPTPVWRGAMVGVLLSGPSMNARVARRMRTLCSFVIAVKAAVRLAPWADMLVALDSPWPQEFCDFAGRRVIGVEVPDLDACHLGHVCERVAMPGGSIEIRNSGLTAVRLAAAMGAARIRVAGFAPEAARRWHDAAGAPVHPYTGVRGAMEQIGRELAAAGIELEFHGE